MSSPLEFLIAFILLVPFWIITLIKKKKQVGRTWRSPTNAVLSIKDKQLNCTHCGHDRFSKREGLITTSWATYFKFPFWNRSAPCFVCENCGFVHWFINPKETLEENS